MSRPEQVSRPAKPALPTAGETRAAAAGTAERLGKLAGYDCGYKVPRLVSPIRESYLENFQALPKILDGCIIKAPETNQERFFFSVLMEAGMVCPVRRPRTTTRRTSSSRGKKKGGRSATKDSKCKTSSFKIKPISI